VILLKTIVGSHAHGLATPASDIDYRGVYAARTRDFFVLPENGQRPRVGNSQWIEGAVDDTSWELGHFLFLACKSNPSVLEAFKSPVSSNDDSWTATGYTLRLLGLFEHVWSTEGVYSAFRGYGFNQRTKMLDNKDGRYNKYAVAWLRTLYIAEELIRTGSFSMSVVGSDIESVLRAWKAGLSSETFDVPLQPHEIIRITDDYARRLDRTYREADRKATEVEPVNDFIIEVRRNLF